MAPAIAMVCLAASLGFVVAGATAGRLAWAEWLAGSGKTEAIKRAVALVPESARYQVLLARSLRAPDPEASRAAFERAASLNPHDAAIWIQLGLLSEALGDFSQGRLALERAVSVSRRFNPKWTLAGFHFRRGNHGEFWRWAGEAAAIAPSQIDALYDLCWRLDPNPERLLERVVPRSARGHRQFLRYLLVRNRTDGVEAAAMHLAAHRRPEDYSLIRGGSQRLIAHRQFAPALRLWNTLCRDELAACETLDPDHGPRLANRDFRRSPSGIGFDWHISPIGGLTCALDQHRKALRLRLSGKQPEKATLLFQVAPVTPGKAYRLITRYETTDLPPANGIRWRVVDLSNGVDIAPEGFLPASERETESTVNLSAAPAHEFVRVELRYERIPGTVRPAGQIILAGVRLEERP